MRNKDLAPIEKVDLEAGKNIEVEIVVIETRLYRIRLSVKKLEYIKSKAILEEINDDESHSLGDLIKDKFK